MSAQGYQYNRPGSQGSGAPSFTSGGYRLQGGLNVQGSQRGGPGSQSGFPGQGQIGSRPGTQAQGDFQGTQGPQGPAFGGPRQPPSFSEEEGYKY